MFGGERGGGGGVNKYQILVDPSNHEKDERQNSPEGNILYYILYFFLFFSFLSSHL